MGNGESCVDRRRRNDPTLTPAGSRLAQRPHSTGGPPQAQRYSVQLLGWDLSRAGGVSYQFLSSPPSEVAPAALAVPGQIVQRTFRDFQDLDAVMARRHRGGLLQELPVATFFEHQGHAFLAERGAGLAGYLEGLLELEPLPRTEALRRFLGVRQPPSPLPLWGLPDGTSGAPVAETAGASGAWGGGPLAAVGRRVPVGVAAAVLAFLEPLSLLRACSAVCRAMWEASRHPRCWPSLRFRAVRAECWLDGLFGLLLPTCERLQGLALDLTFEDARFAVAPPAGLLFLSLRWLELRVGDAESARLAAEILEGVEAPDLRSVEVEGPLAEPLLGALRGVALAAAAAGEGGGGGGGRGGLDSLRLLWQPAGPGVGLPLGEGVALALAALVESAPTVRELVLAASEGVLGAGLPRALAPLQPPLVAIPGTQPLLADLSALTRLRALTFDFLSDDVLRCLHALDDRSFLLSRATFTGMKRGLDDPEEALSLLLRKLGDGLEEFALSVEVELELEPFLRGFVRTRIGALPTLWQGREALRSLVLTWTAFDDDGVRCIVENCPRLHTLVLDRAEHWTDAGVAVTAQVLLELRRFRLRASTQLSDRALYSLADVADRLVEVEVEPSCLMSTHALELLRSRLGPGAGAEGWLGEAGSSLSLWTSNSGGPLALIAAAAGVPYLGFEAAAAGRGGRGGGGILRVLAPPGEGEDEGVAANAGAAGWPGIRRNSRWREPRRRSLLIGR